jgi:hypothetical protein
MVWRRILVPTAFTLRELHGVIQVAMGLPHQRCDHTRRGRTNHDLTNKIHCPHLSADL